MKSPSAKDLPILTRAESALMQLLWHHGPSTVAELVELSPKTAAYNTVLTVLRILEQKGYVAHEPSPENARAFRYRAAVEESQARRHHLTDLVDRLFGGRVDELAVGLVDDEGLSDEELRELRKRIDERLGRASPKRKGGRK